MKKYIVPAIIALLPLASFAEEPEAPVKPQYNTELFATCTSLEENDIHVIYQCPTDIDWIVELKQNEPNAMFQQGPNSDEVWNLVMKETDPDHDYVEVSFADIDKKVCEDGQTPVRVKIKNPEITDELAEPSEMKLWAFGGCK